MNREQLRQEKQAQCDARIEQLHQAIPRLAEIADEISLLGVNRIRIGVLQKNAVAGAAIDKQVLALIAEKKAILQAHGLTVAIYRPQWDCEKCEDRGYIEPGVLCQCYLQERLDHVFQQSGIPVAMKAYSFDNFDVNYYTDIENMRGKVARCVDFVAQVKVGQQKQNLLFLGEVGRGKTHLSIAIANAVLANGNTVIYKRIDDLLDLIRTYKYDREQMAGVDQGSLDQLKQCDLLVIDDLGAETVTAFAINQIRIIIEERNLREKPWIINSNLSLEKIQGVYGERVADRIIEKAAIFHFNSPQSIRILKRMK